MLVPYSFARQQGVLIHTTAEGLAIIASENATAEGLLEVQRMLPVPSPVQWLAPEAFEQAMGVVYRQDASAAQLIDDLSQNLDLAKLAEELPQTEDLMVGGNEAPIIRMINGILTQAIREHASDIHIEPYEKSLIVRFRVDGALREVVSAPRAIHASLVSRIKIMSGLDIAEKRLPQDGRISLRLLDQMVDVRVSTLPTGRGERVVLRLLRKDAASINLVTLGMEAPTLARFDRLVQQPHGIILVTGPTGSGKTTTLYAAMTRLDAKAINIMTVEDPIEYELPGVGQTQVNPRIEMSFARSLRSILRQDPDVVMIGEIRDLETAEIAVQASLTGHLVLATLHTNDAPSAINRLVDMGVEPFLLASSLIGVLAQRLVRKLCPHCREPHQASPEELATIGVTATQPLRIYRPKGCAQCGKSGYSGRVGIFQLLEMDIEMQALVHRHGSEAELRGMARQRGMKLLREDALRWLAQGTTSLDEILRVTAG